jgi:hypothetical protein
MAKQQRKAPDRSAAELYYAEYVQLSATSEGSGAVMILQEAINEGARQSWTLISLAKAPGDDGFSLIWDTSGFFSG